MEVRRRVRLILPVCKSDCVQNVCMSPHRGTLEKFARAVVKNLRENPNNKKYRKISVKKLEGKKSLDTGMVVDPGTELHCRPGPRRHRKKAWVVTPDRPPSFW